MLSKRGKPHPGVITIQQECLSAKPSISVDNIKCRCLLGVVSNSEALGVSSPVEGRYHGPSQVFKSVG